MKTYQILFAVSVALFMSACKEECLTSSAETSAKKSVSGKSSSSSAKAEAKASKTADGKCPVPPTEPEPEPEPPTPPNPPQASKYPLLWEAGHSERIPWSTHAMKVISEELATDLLPGTSDIEMFCPRYHTLANDQRANLWALLISAMSKYESGFNPLSRFHESTMGTDPVTGQPVYSEGLLQLSYQDTKWASFCEFDWQKDKNLAPQDPKKTILDPYKNLSCGIKILARQVRSKNTIAVKTGAYWSVLIPGGKYTKLNEITALTKKMTGCE